MLLINVFSMFKRNYENQCKCTVVGHHKMQKNFQQEMWTHRTCEVQAIADKITCMVYCTMILEYINIERNRIFPVACMNLWNRQQHDI